MVQKSPKTVNVHLPENFSAEQLLSQYKLRKDMKVNMEAAMYYILDRLIRMSQLRKWRDHYDVYGGYPLSAKVLNKLIGKNYTKALKLLESSGVINRTKGYKVGEQSKLYNLTAKYDAAPVKVCTMPVDSTLFSKLLKLQEEYNKRNEAELKKISYITKWFTPGRLKIDIKAAHGLIEFYKFQSSVMVPKKLPKGRSVSEIKSRIASRVNTMLGTMNALQRGDMQLKKTGKDHRLHSVVSNTKKELRSLYTYDGEPMVSVDLKSSQPYLLNVLLNPENWKKGKIISQVSPGLYSLATSTTYMEELYDILMFGTSSDSKVTKNPVFKGFSKILWNQDFYRQIVDQAKKQGDSEVFPDRNAVKRLMMMILFEDKAYMVKTPAFKLFRQWFPKEAELILFIKKLSRAGKIKVGIEEGENYLPLTLQRIESYLMLEEVCKKISKVYPDAPLITVHDCIMTTVKYAPQVEQVTREVLSKLIGVEPGITVERVTQKFTSKKCEEFAREDIEEILDKASAIKNINTAFKQPLLFEPPDMDGDWLIHSRYDEEGGDSTKDENYFVLIDDVTKNNI